MSTTIRRLRTLCLWLYAALFVGSGVFFWRVAEHTVGAGSGWLIPVLFAQVAVATVLATVLTLCERGSGLTWGILIHLQFVLSFNPVALHLAAALRGMASKGAHFAMGFDGNLMIYAILPLNAICVIVYYVWLDTEWRKTIAPR